MATASSATVMDTHNADLFGVPLEIRHKIYGFCSQIANGPDLLLKAWLDKLDAKQAAARAQTTGNATAATANDDDEDAEDEAEAEGDADQGAIEETEEIEVDQEELDTADDPVAAPADASTQVTAPADNGTQTDYDSAWDFDSVPVISHDQDMLDVHDEALAEMTHEGQEEEAAQGEDEGGDDVEQQSGDEEVEEDTDQAGNPSAAANANNPPVIAATATVVPTPVMTGAELTYLMTHHTSIHQLAAGTTPASATAGGLGFTQNEAQGLSDLWQVINNGILGGTGAVTQFQTFTTFTLVGSTLPVSISQQMYHGLQTLQQQVQAQQAQLPPPPPPQPRDTQWRHAVPIIQFSHCPPPMALLLINKQLYNEAIAYYYDILTLKINVTEAFTFTSFYELLTETIANAAFSPIEQVQKVELTFVWDTVWIKSQHTKPTEEDDDEDEDEEDGDGDDDGEDDDHDDDDDGHTGSNPMDSDPATKQSILSGFLNKRADVTADLLRMMPNLKSLKIKWYDSQNSDEAIVQKFTTLEEVQQAVPIMCDVEIEDHFETNAKSVSSTSVLGEKRLEFQALQDGGWNFQ